MQYDPRIKTLSLGLIPMSYLYSTMQYKIKAKGASVTWKGTCLLHEQSKVASTSNLQKWGEKLTKYTETHDLKDLSQWSYANKEHFTIFPESLHLIYS